MPRIELTELERLALAKAGADSIKPAGIKGDVMTISMDKQYRTRDGREVRIYAVDGGGYKEVHGAYRDAIGWVLAYWYDDGKSVRTVDAPYDLIEVKPRIQREYWHNVYPNARDVNIQNTREDADLWAANDRIACIKITIDCEEGEGL
jgi:hypothetical protein